MCIYGNTNTTGSADLFGLACFLGPAVDGSRDLVISWTVEAEISFFFFFSLFFFAFFLRFPSAGSGGGANDHRIFGMIR